MEQEIKKIETQEKEEGATMVEYALLVALIAVVCIAAVTFLGAQASSAFSRIGSNISTT